MIAAAAAEQRELARRMRWKSQRLAWWLTRAVIIGCTIRSCERCGEPTESSYDPGPPRGRSLGRAVWTRCLVCGWSVCQLCLPTGDRIPFVPPVSWTTIEDEIARMRAESIEQ